MKMEETECSETSAYKIQTSGNYPEESIQHSEHGESLKSRMTMKIAVLYDVTPCNLVNSYKRLGGISCRYLQGNRPSFGVLHIGVMLTSVDVSV